MDLLLVSTDRYKFCVLEYDVAADACLSQPAAHIHQLAHTGWTLHISQGS
jgi:hypothetical protein